MTMMGKSHPMKNSTSMMPFSMLLLGKLYHFASSELNRMWMVLPPEDTMVAILLR